MKLYPYDRAAAVRYAHEWAYSRNPLYYDYENLGGDCTNFASQCIFAGSGVMDYTPTYGWYYLDANRKAPAWTGVPYLFNYLLRTHAAVGPAAQDVSLAALLPGDIVQLSFDGARWAHSPVVVSVGEPRSYENVLVAAHTYDADYRPLATYEFALVRCLHIFGVYKW
ncbi:MAG: amidase [Ruminococcaceae bacterium]|nr:amidase [Oscillospiraceae bacterium]